MQKDLESKIDERPAEKILDELFGKTNNNYTLCDVIVHPVKYSPGLISVGKEIMRDTIEANISNTDNQSSTKSLLNFAGMTIGCIAGNIGSTGPHELLHALGHSIAGSTILEIAISPSYGGNFYHSIFPWITTKVAIEGVAGSVTAIPVSEAGAIIGCLSPYLILTPLAIYAIQEAKKTKSATGIGVGLGLLSPHVSAICGDFFFLGTRIVKNTYETIKKEPVYKDIQKEEIQTTDKLALEALLLTGFLLGNRIMGYTYRLSKGLVNSARNYFNKKN